MMWFGYGNWWMALSMTLFWVGVVALVVWAVRTYSARPSDRGRTDARGVLEGRYARGEIDDEEYRHRLQTLDGK